jgi:hypothetical protein
METKSIRINHHEGRLHIFDKYGIKYAINMPHICLDKSDYIRIIFIENNFEIITALIQTSPYCIFEYLLKNILKFSSIETLRSFLSLFDGYINNHYDMWRKIASRKDDNVEVMDFYLTCHETNFKNSDGCFAVTNGLFNILFCSLTKNNHRIFQFLVQKAIEQGCINALKLLKTHIWYQGNDYGFQYLIENNQITVRDIVSFVVTNEVVTTKYQEIVNIIASFVDSGKLHFSSCQKDKLRSICKQKKILNVYDTIFTQKN